MTPKAVDSIPKNLDLISDKDLLGCWADRYHEYLRRLYMNAYPYDVLEQAEAYKAEILRRLTSPERFQLIMTYAKEKT